MRGDDTYVWDDPHTLWWIFHIDLVVFDVAIAPVAYAALPDSGRTPNSQLLLNKEAVTGCGIG